MRNMVAIGAGVVLAVVAGAVAFGFNNGAPMTASGHEDRACGNFSMINARSGEDGGRFQIKGPVQAIDDDFITLSMPLGAFDISLAGSEDETGDIQPGDIVMAKGSIDDQGAFTLDSLHQVCRGVEQETESPTETAAASETPSTSPSETPTGTAAGETETPEATPTDFAETPTPNGTETPLPTVGGESEKPDDDGDDDDDDRHFDSFSDDSDDDFEHESGDHRDDDDRDKNRGAQNNSREGEREGRHDRNDRHDDD